MIAVPLTRDLAQIASLKAEEIPKEIKNSIEKGEKRFIGKLGEAALVQHLEELGCEVIWQEAYNYDMLVDGYKVEVKGKVCNTSPLPNYDCAVCAKNVTQECHLYAFVRVGPTRIWILGYISRERFKEIAVFRAKGSEDPNKVHGESFTYKEDCYVVKVSELRSFREKQEQT